MPAGLPTDPPEDGLTYAATAEALKARGANFIARRHLQIVRGISNAERLISNCVMMRPYVYTGGIVAEAASWGNAKLAAPILRRVYRPRNRCRDFKCVVLSVVAMSIYVLDCNRLF